MKFRVLIAAALAVALSGQASGPCAIAEEPASVLPNTQALESTSDITSDLVDGVDRFLLTQLAQTPLAREGRWPKPPAGPDVKTGEFDQAWQGWLGTQREQLSRIIGLRDKRTEHPRIQLESEPHAKASYAEGDAWTATRARWAVLPGVDATGLWVQPKSQGATKFRAVVIPDAGQTPEHMIGVSEGADGCVPVAAWLAAAGGEVIVTTPVSRQREARLGRATMTDQEFLYRSAFELGRHVLGYQVHEVLSAVDALNEIGTQHDRDLPIVICGWGEGGWIALHAAAVSPNIDAACVSGHFQSREQVWLEPIHRNVQGLLENFGDAELAAMVAPRSLIIDAVAGPEVTIAGDGGAPGRLAGPTQSAAAEEFARTERLLAPWKLQQSIQLVATEKAGAADLTVGKPGPSISAIEKTLASVGCNVKLSKDVAAHSANDTEWVSAQSRRAEMLAKWDRFNQQTLERAADERAVYWKTLKTDSAENFSETIEPFRKAFREDVIGQWDLALEQPNPRSRLVYDQPKYLGYEVVMDVFPDVIAYGVLLLPRDIKAGEQRPCVVFQHGLEGRPKDCIEGDHPAYHDVAARLAEQGFVVFAPQNLYIFHDRFRTLQRKSNPLGKTLFSTIVPQHQQICRWLGQQPQVDPKRIAFYGLSYGGKSAMRIPPLVPEYCLSICSADFNDWVWKNASTTSPYSYVWTMEYEIFEFDLGSRFNYAEMANLIAPRPFMVERGHFDGVAPDERVGLEFAKVRHMYSAKLGLPDAARIEWFVGPHTINGQGTYQFLHEKLRFP